MKVNAPSKIIMLIWKKTGQKNDNLQCWQNRGDELWSLNSLLLKKAQPQKITGFFRWLLRILDYLIITKYEIIAEGRKISEEIEMHNIKVQLFWEGQNNLCNPWFGRLLSNISFSSCKQPILRNKFFCLFTFWVFLPDKIVEY